MRQRSHFSGFTLLEILLVVAAIAILAGIVIVAINPGKQLAEARNATRQTDVKTISDAVYQYSFDHGGAFPGGIDTDLRLLGTDASGCAIDCGSAGTSLVSASISDNSASSFNAGSYSSTVFSTSNNRVQLTNGGSVGTYTSSVKDAGSINATWSTLSWLPQFPAGKELPNNGGIETGYPSGNADMGGNNGLWHLNEISGANFSDASGNNLAGICAVGECPTLGVTGKLSTALSFNGANKQCVNLGNTLNDAAMKNTMTVEGWFKASASGGGIIRTIISKAQFSVDNRMFFLGIWTNGLLTFLVHDDANTSYYTQVPNPFVVDNKWHHLAGTWNQGTQIIYYDGVPAASSNRNFTKLNDSTGSVFIGAADSCVNWFFDGDLDEIAVYDRVLSATEIKDHYLRGATRLKFQARSCSDAACSSASFAGPDGTAGSYYSELSNSTLTTPSFSLSNVSANRYFQYKTTFETDNTAYSPELRSVNIAGTASSQPANSGTAGPTLDACLDLTPLLTSDYLTAIPTDPKDGSANKTYYALKKTANDRITVVACSAENNKSISATR